MDKNQIKNILNQTPISESSVDQMKRQEDLFQSSKFHDFFGRYYHDNLRSKGYNIEQVCYDFWKEAFCSNKFRLKNLEYQKNELIKRLEEIKYRRALDEKIVNNFIGMLRKMDDDIKALCGETIGYEDC